MYRCVVLFLIVVAAGTPAASFWQQALPGTPMPEAIADLVRKGIDDAPRVRRYPAFPSISLCGAWTGMCTASLAAPTGIFFYEAQLRPGSTMTMSFPAEAEPPILPHDLAEKVAFANLSAVLTTFNIPTGSAEASHVAKTLSLCQSLPHAGEITHETNMVIEAFAFRLAVPSALKLAHHSLMESYKCHADVSTSWMQSF
uniref:Uncharacterized protein n=1 Tax=Aegilops tauschii TaxID=37682 RepID=R7W651_AEGTA